MAHLSIPENWTQSEGGVETWQCAAIIAQMVEDALNSECESSEVNPVLQHIQTIDVETTNFISISIPAGDWRYVHVVGKVTAIGTTQRDLLIALGGDTASNRYTIVRNTTTTNATSGTGQTDSAIWTAVDGQNMLAAQNSDPAYSQLDLKIYDPLDTGKTLVEGSLYCPVDDRGTTFKAKHNIAQADNSIEIFSSGGVNIAAKLSVYGVLKNAE